MRTRLLAALGLLLVSSTALAQPRISIPPPPRREPERPQAAGARDAAPLLGRSLRGRTAVEVARQLADAKRPEDRRRAVARATSSLPDDELLAFLASLADRGSPLENDPRALLDVARGLARFENSERALRGLFQLTSVDVHDSAEAPHADAYSAWTRRTAAMAVAQSQSPKLDELATELAGSIDTNEDARAMWTEAFAIPRRAPLPADLVERLPLAFAASADLRAADVLFTAAKQNPTPPLILALARLGDRRATPLLTAADAGPSTAGREDGALAWVEAMVRLRAPKYEERLLELLDDERGAHDAVTVARGLPSERIAQRLGARAAFHPSGDERAQAIEVLGTMPHLLAVRTLLSLALREETRLDAFRALASQPMPDALRVLEQFAEAPPKGVEGARFVRLALRAYAIRATRRGETSSVLEARARTLLESRVAADRSVAAFTLVATGNVSARKLAGRSDATTRRAIAMALRTRPDATADAGALLTEETDPATRMLLAFLARPNTLPDLGPALSLERSVLEAHIQGRTLAPNQHAARERAMQVPAVARRLAFLQGTCEGPHARTMALRLAEAYGGELDTSVRAALVRCLAHLAASKESLPIEATRALEVAAWSERSGRTRSVARGAIAHCASCADTPARAPHSLVIAVDPRSDGAGPAALSGLVISADGEIVPLVFDDDGLVTVLGVAPEGAQLVLSPRYE